MILTSISMIFNFGKNLNIFGSGTGGLNLFCRLLFLSYSNFYYFYIGTCYSTSLTTSSDLSVLIFFIIILPKFQSTSKFMFVHFAL